MPGILGEPMHALIGHADGMVEGLVHRAPSRHSWEGLMRGEG